MFNNNNIRLTGNLTGDVELRMPKEEGKGKAKASYSLAVHAGEDHTDFFRINSWGDQAIKDSQMLKKGMFVALSGNVTTGSYVNKDGVKIPTFVVNAEEVKLLKKKTAQQDAGTSAANNLQQAKDNIAE